MLKWVFGADTKPFRRGLADMRSQVATFSKGIGGQLAGALSFGAAVAGAKAFMDEMGRVKDLSERFGESAETVQKVGNAAKLAGSDLETVAKAMTKVTQNAVLAAQGNDKMREAFAKAGINAAKFADLPLDQKLVELSRAYSQSGSSAAGMSQMLALLGKSAAELIPLLAQGPDALAKSLENAKVVSQSVVDSMAALGDAMDESLQTVKSWAGRVVQVIQSAAATAGQSIVMLSAIMSEGFKNATLQQSPLEGAKNIAKSAKESIAALKIMLDDIWKSSGGPDKGQTDAPDLEAIEERQKLAEDIARLEEEARQRELALEQKILETRQKIADLAKEADSANDENAKLEATKKRLELEADLAKLTKEQESERQKAADKAQKAGEDAFKERQKEQERIDAAKEQEGELDRDQRFSKMTDKEKVAALEKERDALLEKSRALAAVDPFTGKKTDEEGSIKARIEAKRKQGEIDALLGGQRGRELPTIKAEDMVRSGGGGFVNMGARVDPVKETNQRLVELTSIVRDLSAKVRPAAIPSPVDL